MTVTKSKETTETFDEKFTNLIAGKYTVAVTGAECFVEPPEVDVPPTGTPPTVPVEEKPKTNYSPIPSSGA